MLKLKMSFGLDMDTVILKATSGEIGYEIDNEIMQDLLKIAGSQSTWNKLPEYKGQDVKTHEATLFNAIQFLVTLNAMKLHLLSVVKMPLHTLNP